MNKKEFLAQSRKRLSNLPQEEIEERLAFYSEMIDDRMEEGLSETDAVEQMMSSDETVAHLFADEVFQKGSAPSAQKSAQKSVKTALLVAGSPLWIVLMITAVALWISLLVAVWSVVVALWAVFVSLAVSAPVAVLCGGVVVVLGKPLAGLAMLGTGLVCAGLAVFSYYGAKVVTQGCWWLTKKSLPTLTGCFAKKEEAYE